MVIVVARLIWVRVELHRCLERETFVVQYSAHSRKNLVHRYIILFSEFTYPKFTRQSAERDPLNASSNLPG